MASAMGGLFGAAVLYLSLPILRPLVLSFGSPEFLVLVIWGLSAVGVLSGGAPIKGLIAAVTDVREGIKDAFRHWWLVIRCSAIGVWVGVLPGLGSTVADWFAYAHAVQTEKNPENFGKGDVRGVIAFAEAFLIIAFDYLITVLWPTPLLLQPFL